MVEAVAWPGVGLATVEEIGEIPPVVTTPGVGVLSVGAPAVGAMSSVTTTPGATETEADGEVPVAGASPGDTGAVVAVSGAVAITTA